MSGQPIFACAYCGQSPSQTCDIILWRASPKGAAAIWLCTDCLLDNTESIVGDDGNPEPFFVHDKACPSFCDYACNPRGFEMGEYLKKTAKKLERTSSVNQSHSTHRGP